MIESQRHSYHLVDPSPWPISGSLGALATTVGGVMYMHSFQGGATLLSLGLIFILYTMFVWWRDVLRESTLEGHHTKVVQLGLRYGFILFIVSEVMFFFAFFWAFFHSSLAPTVEIGGIWPPKGIGVLDPWEIPFLHSIFLLSLVWNHHHYTFIVGLAAGLAIPPSRRLECSLPVEDRNVCNLVLHTGKMKTEFVRILPHVQSFFSGFPRDLYH